MTRYISHDVAEDCWYSLYEEGYQEALRHRWNQSQERGLDLGTDGEREWYDLYWSYFCRLKFLDHICGKTKFREFTEKEHGLVNRLFKTGDLLFEMILDRAYFGKENLELINWALEWRLPMDRVMEILELLNLNRAQFMPTKPPQYATPGEIKPKSS